MRPAVSPVTRGGSGDRANTENFEKFSPNKIDLHGSRVASAEEAGSVKRSAAALRVPLTEPAPFS
jgi:hypothetical protein